jgi:hypothetical protein
MKRLLAVSGLVAVFAMTGCQSAPSYRAYTSETQSWGYGRKVSTMFKDQFLDLADIVTVNLNAGEGLLVNARPTKLAQVGGGHFNGVKFGWNQRAVGFWREHRTEGGASVLYYTDAEFVPVHGTRTLFDQGYVIEDFTILHNEDRHWLDIGASAHLLYLGGDVNVSPKEVFDFVLGLINIPLTLVPIHEAFGIRRDNLDLSDDDTASVLRRKYQVGYIEQPHGLNISTSDSADRDID